MENRCKVLIITDEPIFSFGLRVQFIKWNFASVDITGNCGLALQSIQKQLPSLVIIDEKFLESQEYSHLVLISSLLTIPIIVLTAHPERILSTEGIWKESNHYTFLSKPCKIADLKTIVEKLLQINILLATND